MPVLVVLLVVASAAVHAAWNAVLKRRHDPENAVFGVMGVSALTAVLAAAVLGGGLPAPKTAFYAVLAGLLEAGYFVTLARALARAPLGPVYTVVRGGALVLVWPVSVALLGERMTSAAAFGTVLVLGGLGLTGASERVVAKEAIDASPPTVRAGTKPSLARRYRWAITCAVFVAGYHVAYKLALSSGGAPHGVVAVSLTTAAVASLLGTGSARRAGVARALGREPWPILLAGTLATVSFLVFLEAMARAGAGAVLTLRNTSILFAQALAIGLGDKPRRLGLAGAGLVTLGAVLLAR